MKVDGKGRGKTRLRSIRAKLPEEAGMDAKQNSKDAGSHSKTLILYTKETQACKELTSRQV